MGRHVVWSARWSLGLLILSGCMSTGPASPPPSYPPEDRPVEGYRYEAMRVLSERLVERLEATTREAQRDARLAIDETLALARDFAAARNNYQNPNQGLRRDLSRLDASMRDIDGRLEPGDLTSRGREEWRRAMEVLNDMIRLSRGEDVNLPPTSPSPDDRFPREGEYQDVRRLAHELAVRATLAHENASRSGSDRDRDRRLLSDLDYFRSRARDLDTRASGEIRRVELGPVVRSLHEDARRIERSLSDASASSSVRQDWSAVMRILDQLRQELPD